MKRSTECLCAILVAVVLSGTQCDQAQKTDLNGWRNRVLPQYFEQPAVGELETVPMFYAENLNFGGFAVGDDWGSRLLSVYYGLGNMRQVILAILESDYPIAGRSLIFHEYIHQAEYSGLISRSLFKERLEQLRGDTAYAQTAADLDEFLAVLLEGGFVEDLPYTYDDGINREAMAYLIEFWADGCFDLPDYVLEVYAGVVLPDPASRSDETMFCLSDILRLPVSPCTSGFHVREDEPVQH